MATFGSNNSRNRACEGSYDASAILFCKATPLCAQVPVLQPCRHLSRGRCPSLSLSEECNVPSSGVGQKGLHGEPGCWALVWLPPLSSYRTSGQSAYTLSEPRAAHLQSKDNTTCLTTLRGAVVKIRLSTTSAKPLWKLPATKGMPETVECGAYPTYSQVHRGPPNDVFVPEANCTPAASQNHMLPGLPD